MIYFTEVYEIFLNGITSCTLADFTDEEIEEQLFHLLMNAITRFKFPKVSLLYEIDKSEKYFFVENITQKEIQVLVAFMRAEWLNYQVVRENNFIPSYFDTNARTHSKGALISQLIKAQTNAELLAKEMESSYYRINTNNRPSLGDIKW